MISSGFTLHCKSFLIFPQRTRTDPDRTLYVSPACASRKGFYNAALTWSWLLGLFPSPLCFSLNICKKMLNSQGQAGRRSSRKHPEPTAISILAADLSAGCGVMHG